MRYEVTVGDRVVEVDLTGAVPIVNGTPIDAHLEVITGTPVRHLLGPGTARSLLALPGRRRGEWRIVIDGRTVFVEALDERTRAIREMSGGAEGAVERVIVAPMPGLIVQVQVEPGETITAGQGVVVVEAMKMENELKAPADGVVARVEVKPGQAVEKGAVLVVLE